MDLTQARKDAKTQRKRALKSCGYWRCFLIQLVLIGLGMAVARVEASSQKPKSKETPVLQVTMQVDFGKDIGQSFGSLLEVRDSRGHVIAGAGFADVYNTMFRNDRYTVQFFVQPNSEDNQFTLEPLPRPIKEYGQVIRLKRPGNLAATMQPRGNPTELEFLLTRDSMTILQDGKQLASTKFGSKLTAEFKPASIAWGKGTFGPLQRTIRSNTVKPGIRG